MKKFISILLALVIVLGLCACGGEGGGEGGSSAKGLQVGFGKEKITPSHQVQISGGGDSSRLSNGYKEYLYTTCIALTDASGNTVLIYTQDLQEVSPSFADPARKQVSEATGVPVENIMISATHTHSAPGANVNNTGIAEYKEIYLKGMVKAAQTAMADRSAAEISIGSTQATGLVFVRHYELSNGTFAGSSFGNFGSGSIVGHSTPAQEELQIIKFTRAAEDKKDVVLFNLGAHATYFSPIQYRELSTDFPGPARDYVEEQTGCLAAYFMSAAGDQIPDTKIASEDHGLDYKGYGQAVGKLVVEALPNLKSVNSGDIKINQKYYAVETNTRGFDRYDDAKKVYDFYKDGGGKEGADAMAVSLGFIGVYEARAIVNNKNKGESTDINLNAVSIGDISFVFAPYEMFGVNGKQIRDGSPYEMTFVASQSNETYDYIPSERGYEIDCYEAYTSFANKGTGEKLADFFVDMLKELKGA